MLTDLFGAHPEVRILEFLAGHREFDYTVSEIARNSGVSRPATYKVLEKFVQNGVVARTRRVGASWFFRLEAEHELVRPFLDLEILPAESPRRRRLTRSERSQRG